MTEYVLEYGEKEVVPKDITKFMDFISDRYEKNWVLFLSNGEIISDRSLKKALESYKERKNVRIELLVKAPSKNGVMFR